jgi:hypothetical protein
MEGQRCGQIGQKRKGMLRIENQRHQSRRNAASRKTRPASLLLRCCQLIPATQKWTPVFGQPGNDRFGETGGLFAQASQQPLAEVPQQLRALPSRGPLAQHGHPLHEELVQVGREDGEKLGPLKQRGTRSSRASARTRSLKSNQPRSRSIQTPESSVDTSRLRTPSSPIDTIVGAALIALVSLERGRPAVRKSDPIGLSSSLLADRHKVMNVCR